MSNSSAGKDGITVLGAGAGLSEPDNQVFDEPGKMSGPLFVAKGKMD